jgi:hypothetical protein
MTRTARLFSVLYLLCGLIPALAHAQAPTAATAQSATTASPGAPAAKAEPPATAQTRQISVQAGTGVLLRLPQPVSPMQKAETAPPRVRANLGILYAAAGDVDRSRQLLGNQLSDDDLLKVTQALTSSSPEGRKRP